MLEADVSIALDIIVKLSIWPDISAGARERAGFMEAPETGPPKRASSATVAPTATPAIKPFSFASVATLSITNIRKKVKIISRTKDCIALPEGFVAPSVGCCAKR